MLTKVTKTIFFCSKEKLRKTCMLTGPFLSGFDHCVGLALKGLNMFMVIADYKQFLRTVKPLLSEVNESNDQRDDDERRSNSEMMLRKTQIL